MYQGLGMPNMPLISLSKKISFLLGNWGFPGQVHSDALAMSYDNFLIEVGLYGKPLQWSYTEYGRLATNATWFQNLWQLAFTYQVNISFQMDNTVQGRREHDRSLISELHRIGYRGKRLAALNVVPCY
jgi:hypothetical protein